MGCDEDVCLHHTHTQALQQKSTNAAANGGKAEAAWPAALHRTLARGGGLSAGGLSSSIRRQEDPRVPILSEFTLLSTDFPDSLRLLPHRHSDGENNTPPGTMDFKSGYLNLSSRRIIMKGKCCLHANDQSAA